MSGYIGTTPTPQATQTRDVFTATAGQTSFATSGYTVGFLDVYVNGSHLKNGTDYTATNGSDVVMASGLAVNDYVEVVAFTTFSPSDSVSAASGGTFSGDVSFGDSVKAIFGAGSDLQIYHDGSNSYVRDNGTGTLTLQGSSQVKIQSPVTGENYAIFNDNGAVTLNYDNSLRLTTTSTGVDITGTLTSDGLTVDKGSAGTLATFTDGVNSNFVIETASLITTVGNTGGSTALAFKSANTERLRIDSSGNVGIGTSSPAYTIDAASSGNTQIHLKASGQADGLEIGQLSADGGSAITATNNNYLKFGTNNTERMRIASNGTVLVGKTAEDNSTVGVRLNATGDASFVADGGRSLIAARNSSDGDIQLFLKDNTTVGSIGVKDGTNTYIGSGAAGFAFSGSGPTITPYNTTANNYTDNTVDLGNSFNRFKDLYLSGGVYLGGTGAANKLDDYEEGTFTVSWLGATVSPTYNTAYYTKIGRLVYWTHYTGSTTISSVTAALRISGLPFTVKTAVSGYSTLTTSHQTFFNSVNVNTGYHAINTNFAYFILSNTTTAASAVAGSSKFMMVSGVYMTDS